MMLNIIKNYCGWLSRTFNIVAYLTAENLALRQQLLVLKRCQTRPKLKERERVKSVGIQEVLIAYQSPWHNPYVERLHGSIRRECLDHVIVFNENHLRKLLRSYFEHYQEDRTHLGLGKDTPLRRPTSNRASPISRVVELPRVGGLHHRYEWSEAA